MKKILSILMLVTILTASAASAAEGGARGFVIHTGDVWTSVNGVTQVTEGAVIVKPDGTTESCVYINGKVYVDNDEVSADHNGRSYTWRVTGLTENRILKLDRVSTHRLENSSTKGNKK